jgi:hypothetical protein
MNIFDRIKGIGQVFKSIDRTMVKEFGKQAVKFAAKKLAEQHLNKKYKAVVYNAEGISQCEMIITPKSDTYIVGLANVVNDSFEVHAGKLKIDIRLMAEE